MLQQNISSFLQFLLQMKKIVQHSTATHCQPLPLPLSKQTNPKDKYKLILAIEELKQPVLSVVQSIIARPQQKQNIIRNVKAKSATKSQAVLKQHNRSTFTETHKALNTSNELHQSKKPKGKGEFTQKVHRLFASKKYNYNADNEEDNIDRLNAKLDKYISRYLGPERLKDLKQG